MTTDNIFDVGPTPPPWTLPGAAPNWDSLNTEDGTTVLSWTRDVGGVWIACDATIEAGEWAYSAATIRFCEPPRGGLDAAGARRLAAELLEAAQILDEAIR